MNFLSTTPSLYVFGQTKFHTLYSLFLSILIFILCFAFSVYSLYECFRRKEIHLFTYNEPGNAQEFNLSDSFFMLSLAGKFDKNQAYGLAYYNRMVGDEISSSPIYFEFCDKNQIIAQKYSHLFYQKNLSRYYCIKPYQNVIIKNDPSTQTRFTMTFVVKLCDEDDGTVCDTKEKMAQVINSLSISMSYIIETNTVEHNSNKNPFGIILNEVNINPDVNYFSQEKSYWNVINYDTDNGYVFENRKKYNGIIVNREFSSYNAMLRSDIVNSKIPLVEVELAMAPNGNLKIVRTYRKIQSYLGDIVGVIFLFEFIGKMLINIFTGSMYYSKLTQNIFEDNQIYKGGQLNKRIYQEDDNRQIKITNNTSTNNGEPSAIQFVKIEKGNGLIPMTLMKDTPKLQKNNVLNARMKTSGGLQNEIKKPSFYTRLTIGDYFSSNFFCLKSRNTELIELSEHFVKSYLTCDGLIKDSINLEKIVNILEDGQGVQLNQIKPEFIQEIEHYKANNKHNQ